MSEEAKKSIPTMKEENNSKKPSSPGKKVVIKSADMKEDMQKEAIDIAISAFEKNNVEKDVAEFIKKEFDEKHGPTWHCIVGRNFDYMKQEELLNRQLGFVVKPEYISGIRVSPREGETDKARILDSN